MFSVWGKAWLACIICIQRGVASATTVLEIDQFRSYHFDVITDRQLALTTDLSSRGRKLESFRGNCGQMKSENRFNDISMKSSHQGYVTHYTKIAVAVSHFPPRRSRQDSDPPLRHAQHRATPQTPSPSSLRIQRRSSTPR